MFISLALTSTAVLLADLRQQQAEVDATFGDLAIVVLLVFHFLEHGFGIVGTARGFLLQLRPDLVEFGIDHALRGRQSRDRAASVSSSWRFIWRAG